MTTLQLIAYLNNPHCPKDAEIVVYNEKDEQYIKPQVVWWSDDRKTVYIGYL